MFGLSLRCVVGAFYKVVAFYMCIFLTFLSKLGGAYYILKRFIVRKVRYVVYFQFRISIPELIKWHLSNFLFRV